MNGNIKIKGQLKLYMQWPVIMVLLLLLMDLCIFRISIKGGVIATCFIAVYLAIAVFQYHNSRADILNELISFATQYGQVQKSLLRDFIVPYALVDGRGRILWMNEAFSQLSQKPVKYHRSITSIFQEITIERLPKDESSEVLFQFENRDYRASMRKISIEAMLEDSGLIESDADNFLTAIYIFDETDVNRYKKERDEEKLVTGLLYLDNYEEALNSVEEVRRSLLVALIERKLNKYFSEMDGLVKKLEKDKFILILCQRSLEELKEKGYKLAICSNASKWELDVILRKLEVNDYFDVIQGVTEKNNKKYSLEELLLREKPELAVMVGDRSYDKEAARYNQIPFVGCKYGYGKPEELSDCKYSVETALELSRIIDEIISARGGAD